MASLSSLIDARYKSPSATITFNGNKAKDVISVGINSVLEGSITSASIRTLSSLGLSPENKVIIKQGYNGKEERTFTGYIDSIERNENDGSYTVACRDVLKKALDTFLVQEVKFGQDISKGTYYYSTYTSNDGGTFTIHEYASIGDLNTNHPETTGNYTSQGVKAEAVVQWLLHMSGLAEGTEIQVDDTNFWIGDINPAKFHLTSVYDAAMQIANLIGWRIYTDQGGVARFRRKPRQPGGYSSWKYTDKAEPFNVLRASKTSSNIDLRNYVEVRGASGIRSIQRAPSPYIGNTPYRGVLISEELIDTQGIADFICTRVLQDLNRLKISVQMEADGNPLLYPGSTLDLKTTSATGKFLIESVQTNMSADGGYKMTIGAAAYLGDTKFDEDPDPAIQALFNITSLAILGDPRYIVEFSGASSYSDRGLINRYVWDWPDGSHTDSTESTAFFIFDEANISEGSHQDVTLTVYDTMGNTASTTSGITASGILAQVDPKYRQLYGALTTVAVGSLDGGQSWSSYDLPAVSVAASNFGPGGIYVTSGYALFGTSTGKIYKTNDCCMTMYEVNSPGGEVVDIHIPELDSSKAAAVTSTGKVLYSDTYGETWRQIGSFAFPLREVKLGFTDFKYVEIVGSGVNHLYQSFDTGATWNRLTNTLDVLWATDGSSTNYYAHTGGLQGVGPLGVSNYTFSGGVNYSLPAATVQVDDDSGVMVVDYRGQGWNAASGFVLNPTHYNPDNLTRHMIRDGELPKVVYFATQSGISKSTDNNVTLEELYYPGADGKKVAYGPLAGLVIPGRLVFRGSLTVSGFHYSNWWFISSTAGWLPQFPEYSFGMVAQTTAGFAVDNVSADQIDYIECITVSGSSVAQLVLHSGWVSIAGKELRTMAFNNRPDSRHMLCLVVSDTSGNILTESISNFKTTRDLESLTIDGPGTIRSMQLTKITSQLGEMFFKYNYTFFSPPGNVSVVYNSDGSMTQTTVVDNNSYSWAPYHKAAKQYKALARNGSDGTVLELVTGYNGSSFSAEPVAIDAAPILGFDVGMFSVFDPAMYMSLVDQSRVFYATGEGVYSAEAYGQGDINRIFSASTVPSGAITGFRLSSDSTNTSDYLTVIVRIPDSTDARCFYSTDGGDTFIEGPFMEDSSGGGSLYLVDF